MADLGAWPALVLAAGLGTRLAPLSSVRAKAALPVAGEILIHRILRHLRDAGVRRVVVNLHHRAETITRTLGDGRDLGISLRYSWEDPVRGSAGGPRRALPLLEAERFLIVNGDTLTDVDLGALVDRHERSHALVTMAVTPGDTARYGGVITRPDGSVTGFAPRDPAGADTAVYHFIGAQAAEARAFADVPDEGPSETVKWLYPRLIASETKAIGAWLSDAEFLDVGTPLDYLHTSLAIARRENRPLDVGGGAVIAPTATVERSILWDRVSIGPGARLVDCIVADDVVIPAGGCYERKAIVMVDGRPVATSI